LFPQGMLDEMFAAYTLLLEHLATQEQRWQQNLPHLTPPAQLQQRAAINATQAPISPELLHTLFANQVALRPEQPAVIDAQRHLTYSELYQLARQTGHRLRQLGARPNTLVAVVLEKGWQQVVAVLAILQAGAAYLPIDPTLPKERFLHLLEHGQVTLALTHSSLKQSLSWPAGVQQLCLDQQEHTEATLPPLASWQQPQDLAYVIYTSGSTGLPKGVMIDHRGAVNTILDINRRFQVGPTDRVLALSSLNFDLSVYDIFGTLAAGGTIVRAGAIRRIGHSSLTSSRSRSGTRCPP
jgi:pyochelin synthetase